MKSTYNAQPGSTLLLLHAVLLIVSILFLAYADQAPLGLLLLLVSVIMVRGYFVIKPKHIVYISFFGAYRGVVTQTGLFWVNPLLQRKQIQIGQQYYAFQNQSFCDAQGTSLKLSSCISWEIIKPELAFPQVETIEKTIEAQTQVAWAYILERLPYQGKDEQASLKGNKLQVERMVWQQLQERLHSYGLQLTEVALIYLAIDDEAYLQALQQKQQLSLETQAQKSWALQAVPIASHLAKQLQAQPNAPQLDPAKEHALIEKTVLALIKKGNG